MAKGNGDAGADEPILRGVAATVRSYGALTGAAACAMAWALLIRFSGLLFTPVSTVSQSGALGLGSLAGLLAGVLLIPKPKGARALWVLAALGALCAAVSTVFLGLPSPTDVVRAPTAYGVCGLVQGIAYAAATLLAVACYCRLGFRGSLVVAASSFTLAFAAFVALAALLPHGAAWCAALLPVAAAALFVPGWRRFLVQGARSAQRSSAPGCDPSCGPVELAPSRAVLLALLVLAGLLAVYMPAMYPKTTNLASQALGSVECMGLASWRCVAALALVVGLLWLAVGIAYRRRATATGAVLLAVALFAAIFFMLPSMGTSAAAFVLFVACGILAALFAAALLVFAAGQGDGRAVRRGLAAIMGGGLGAAVFAYVFLGPLYNVTMFQDTLFSVVPAVLLIAFVGTVFVLRTFVARALAAWGVRFGGGTAGLGRATEGPVMTDDGSGRAALESFAARRGLTKREVEVLLLLAEGRNEPYIESALGISRTTVKTHITHIYRKVGVSSRQQLIDVLRG